MRLICPNCGAQYEVPESVIPETGRDVQCSGCGHTWFQPHRRQEEAAQTAPATGPEDDDLWDDAEDQSLFEDDRPQNPAPAPRAETRPPAPERAAYAPADDTPAEAPATDDPAEEEWQGFPSDPGLTAAPRAGTDLVPDPEDPVSRLPEIDEDDYEEDPANDLPPPRRSLDTSVADLLREEAEREARARAAERGPGLESQPDLGLDSGPVGPAAPREGRMQTTGLRAEHPAARSSTPPPPPTPAAQRPVPQTAPQTDPQTDQIAAAAAAAVADSRRALLPDIEEINSSLRSTSDRRPSRADDHDTPGQSADPRQVEGPAPRGFSRGFSVTLLIAMLLLALYIFAPLLAQTVPALTPALDAYVAVVDQLRLALDAQVQNLSRWLAQVAGSTG